MSSGEARITYEDYLQSEQIIIMSSSLTDDQLACLAKIRSAKPFPVILFDSDDLAFRFSELERRRHQQEARDWLTERGLLNGLPKYDPRSEQPIEFARRIETFCGIEAGSALEQHKELGTIAPKMEWLGRPLHRGWLWRTLHGKRHQAQFECLMKAMAASNAEEHGVHFGFVGNQAVIESEPQP